VEAPVAGRWACKHHRNNLPGPAHASRADRKTLAAHLRRLVAGRPRSHQTTCSEQTHETVPIDVDWLVPGSFTQGRGPAGNFGEPPTSRKRGVSSKVRDLRLGNDMARRSAAPDSDSLGTDGPGQDPLGVTKSTRQDLDGLPPDRVIPIASAAQRDCSSGVTHLPGAVTQVHEELGFECIVGG